MPKPLTFPVRVTSTIRKVENLRNPAACWCLQWASPVMPAPAFWYFTSEAEAKQAQAQLGR